MKPQAELDATCLLLDVETVHTFRETVQNIVFLLIISTNFGKEDFAQAFTVCIVLMGHNGFIPDMQQNSIQFSEMNAALYPRTWGLPPGDRVLSSQEVRAIRRPTEPMNVGVRDSTTRL